MAGSNRCENCNRVGVPSDDTLCRACQLERDEGPEAKRLYLQNIGKRGGNARARGREGLADQDLPPLTDHEAAETWADRIGRAAATGRISSSAANAGLRAVREWREAREAGKVSEKLEELTDALAEWRRTGDPEPVLSLVGD